MKELLYKLLPFLRPCKHSYVAYSYTNNSDTVKCIHCKSKVTKIVEHTFGPN